MKLTDNLKKQADNAADIEKKTIKKAGMKLSDGELDTVSGGFINRLCEYNPNCDYGPFSVNCSNCEYNRKSEA